MKQIYHFDRVPPPSLNEAMLRAEIEKRKLRIQTALAALAGILLQIAVLLLGFTMLEQYSLISLFCFSYVLLSAVGGSIIAVVFTGKGGLSIWEQ